jgi:hypothetical protein
MVRLVGAHRAGYFVPEELFHKAPSTSFQTGKPEKVTGIRELFAARSGWSP